MKLKDVQLSAGDLYEVLGLSRKTLEGFVSNGVVGPGAGGGKGHHRTYDLVDVLAAGYALEWYALGSPAWGLLAAKIVRNLGRAGVERLLNEGRTQLWPPPDDGDPGVWFAGPLTVNETGQQVRFPDLREVCDAVTAKIDTLTRNARRVANATGRNRVLVLNSLKGA